MITTPRNNSLNIAIVQPLDYPGGVQYCVISLIRALNQRGITPTLLWDHAPNMEFLNKEQVQVQYQKINFRIPSAAIRKYPVTLQYLLTILNTADYSQFSQQFDFIYLFYNGFLISGQIPHIRYLSGPPLLPQLENPRQGLLGVPYRSIRQLYKTCLRHHLPAYEFHHSNHYVINSKYTAHLFKEAHAQELEVVYPPIFFNGRHFDFNDMSQRNTVTFFSRFTPAKRPDMVLELAKTYPGHYLFMGGVTEETKPFFQKLKASAKNIENANIKFFANPDSTVLLNALKTTKFYVFPAKYEHFGMTTAEAIASGVIPFVHDSGGQKEIVPFPELRFQDDNFHAKFAKLSSISDDELNQIRKSLFDHVKQFSAENFNQKMLSFAGL
jgi:glycosyltransferase involved in cell wall biosynthesis